MSGASSSLGLLSEVAGIVVVISGAAGGVVTFLLRRRNTSGQINTSEAGVLWQQSQDMRDSLIAEKHVVEEQRDRLMALQSDKIIPALEGTNATLNGVQDVLRGVLTAFDRQTALLDEILLRLKELR